MKSTYLINVSSQSSRIIDVPYSNITIIDDIIINNINTNIFSFTESTVDHVRSLQLYNASQGMSMLKKTFLNFENRSLAMLGPDSIVYGGAIDISDSSINFDNTVFDSNYAQSGAAISITWSSISAWVVDISNTNFTRNIALTQGGAIYYDFVRPGMIKNYFEANQAQYGHNIASYAVRIVELGSIDTNIMLDRVASGITLSNSPTNNSQSSLQLALVDFDNQVMVQVDSSNIKITAVDDNAKLVGTSEVLADNGISVFDDIGFSYKPGAQNIKFVANSIKIDQSIVEYLELPTDNSISVSFRY